MKRAYTVYLLLGSNLPYCNMAPQTILNEATIFLRERLQRGLSEQVFAESKIHKTKPVGEFKEKDGSLKTPMFCNKAIMLSTPFSPTDILRICQECEIAFGRKRDFETLSKGEDKEAPKLYSSRSLDVDILKIYDQNGGEITMQTRQLQIPHPQIETRPFVKRLLKELPSPCQTS